MILTSKHQDRQTTIIRADFSGGLNQTANADGINENQLSIAVNVEAEHNTGRLKTVAGTLDVAKIDGLFAAMYDEINKKMLVVLNDKTVHILQADKSVGNSLGKLTGGLYPKIESWEDGILIASGGKLQYYNGTTLETINDSPETDSVYVRAGRVLVSENSNLRFSGVGDETNWQEVTNDASSAKWIEIGYKDGGKIVGMINLYSDVLIIKDNRRVYRLQGEYPDWLVSEVTRNVECSGRLSFCAVADRVFILGKNELQMISSTDSFGDMKPTNVAALVTGEIMQLPQNALLRYVPPMQQIWCINGNDVMMFDLNFNAWFKREFNSAVVDVISVGNEVFVIKGDRISKLDENSFFDADKPLRWQFKAQRMISMNNFLLKRTQISCIPLSTILYTGQIIVGGVRVPLPIPAQNIKVKDNKSAVYKNRMKVGLDARKKTVYVKGENVYENLTPVKDNKQKVFSRPTFIKVSKQIYRSKFLDVAGQGSAGGFLLNGIVMEIAEV